MPLAFASAKKHRSLVYIFSGLILFCIMITGKLFPLNLLLERPPFTYIVVNYAFPSALLMTALLAAYGLDTALSSVPNFGSTIESENTNERPRLPAILTALSLLLALAVVAFPLISQSMHLQLISANFDMCLPDFAFNRHDVLRYGIFAIVAGLAVLAVKLKPVRKTAIFLIAAVALGQSAQIITANKSIPKRPPFKYEEPTIIPGLRRETNNGMERFIATGTHLLRPNTNVVFGVSDLRTHNPLFPRRYIAFVKACGAKLDEFNQTFDSPLSPMLSLASVTTAVSQTPVLSQREAAISKEKRQPISVEDSKKTGQPLSVEDSKVNTPDWRLVYESPARNGIYKNKNALPRAYMVHRALVAQDGDAALKAIQNSWFNPGKEVILENSPALEPESKGEGENSSSNFGDKVQIESADPDKIVIKASTATAAVLVLNDMYYPGWECHINGLKETIRRANFTMRAVPLAPGNHRIVFEYRPFSLAVGWLLFLAALAEGLILVAKHFNRKAAGPSSNNSQVNSQVVDVASQDGGQSGDIDNGETQTGT